MPTKINVTSHIYLHTWSRRTKFFHIPDGREITLAAGHQDDNKNTHKANILCSLTFKVFQKHTFFHIKHLRPPSPKRLVAETAAPNCPRPLDLRRRAFAFARQVSTEWSRCPSSMARRARDSAASLRRSSAGWMPARIGSLSDGVGRWHPVTIRKASLIAGWMRRV